METATGGKRIIIDPDATPEEKFRAYLEAHPPPPRPRRPPPTGWRLVREKVILGCLWVLGLALILLPLVPFISIMVR